MSWQECDCCDGIGCHADGETCEVCNGKGEIYIDDEAEAGDKEHDKRKSE